MQKYLIICLVLCVAILSGCDKTRHTGINVPIENQVSYLEEKYEHKTLKIIDGAETGNLILAGTEKSSVYTLDATNIEILIDGNKAELKDLEDGMPLDIYYEGDFDNINKKMGAVVDITSWCKTINGHTIGTERNPGGSLYDLSGLYLKVLEDL